MSKTNPNLDMRKLALDNHDNYKHWKKQRIRQGFSTRDLWNMDAWLCNVIPDALDKLMEIQYGYPASWDSKGGVEAYREYVKQIATDIRQANKLIENISEDNMKQANELIQSAFARLASIIWTLWD